MIKESQIVGMSRSRNFKDKKRVAQFLGFSFSSLKDRKVGWEVLCLLVNDPNKFVKSSAIKAIRMCFAYIPDKENAWQYLLHTVEDPRENIRMDGAIAISRVFDILPNKQKAWLDLSETIKKSANTGNIYAAYVMHDCFDCLEDKEKFIDSLKQLVDTGDIAIRSVSNNLIGRILISKSVKLKGEEFNKTYLEGLTYLKKSFDEFDISRHKFCYFMHNIFNKIIEGELKDVSEINKGIEELKTISEESTEKKKIVRILDELHIIFEKTLEAQKKGEDISDFKEKIIPICTELNILIGTLNNEIIRHIAEKAKERINFEYKCTIKALEIVDNLIKSPDKLISEPILIVETLRLCCISISEPICNSYRSRLNEIEKESFEYEKQAKLLQFIKEIKPVLEHEKSLKEIIISGQNEIKGEIEKVKGEVGKEPLTSPIEPQPTDSIEKRAVQAKIYVDKIFEHVQSGKLRGRYINETSLEDYYDQIVKFLNTKCEEYNKAKQDVKLNNSHQVQENLSQATENLEAVLLEVKKIKYCIEKN